MFTRPTISIDDPAFEAVQIVPRLSYTRRMPLLISAPEWVRSYVQGQLEGGTVVAPAARLARVKDAIVINRGILIDNQNRIISESLINYDERRFDLEVADMFDSACASAELPSLPAGGGPCVMLKQTWDGNYGHWIVESLPRLAVVARHYGVAGLRFIVSDNASSAMRKVYADSLAMMGIAPKCILPLPDEAYRIADVVYPTPMTVQPWVKSPAIVEILEALSRYAGSPTPAPERLFVSRNGWGGRTLLNEAAVLKVLDNKGFVVVQPETLSFVQQIQIFSRARQVIGTLGAALSNIAFAPTGVKLLALTTEQMCDDFFWDLVSLKGGQYISVHGRAAEPTRGMHANFSIDIPDLKSALAALDEG
jgi:hypothetical protein